MAGRPSPNAETHAHVVRRTTLILAGGLALTWAVVQLAAALAAVTLAELTGRRAVAGVAPALFLGGWAIAGPTAGRVMDVRGRRVGLLVGFVLGSATCLGLWAATERSMVPGFLAGIAVLGMALGALNLGARAGAADLYRPERRARGIAFVLVGAAAGAILGPLAFAGVLEGVRHHPAGLAGPWLLGAALMAAGVITVFLIRVDPIAVGRSAGVPAPPTPLSSLVRRPGVAVAVLAAVAAQGLMSATMTVIGVALVEHGHDLREVSFTLSTHFLGMFSLVRVVGPLVDRIGRRQAMTAGLIVLALSEAVLAAGIARATILPAMFGIGLGWNISYVAATAAVADATLPSERARLLGVLDLAATGTAAAATIAAGAILDTAGLPLLAVGGAVLALLPLAVLLRRTTALAVPAAACEPR